MEPTRKIDALGESLHTFSMKAAFSHEDEGSSKSSPVSVIAVMENAKKYFPGVITARQLARSLDTILTPKGFDKEKTLLATSFCCDEVCRDLEDELKALYGQNFSFGGTAGLPFGGNSAFGAMLHHVPKNGNIVIAFGPHVGIDFDANVGKVNRRGHLGSGACCNTAIGAMAYVKAVKEGSTIDSPDPSDPCSAQQVFLNAELMKHSDRLLGSPNPDVELPHCIFDSADTLLKRILDKCLPADIQDGTKIALLGGIQVNSPVGTPEYFLPKKFYTMDRRGGVKEDLLSALIVEGSRDIKTVLKEKRIREKMAEESKSLVDLPIAEYLC